MNSTIREIVDRHGRLGAPISSVADNDDLVAQGMTSQATVAVMLALEDQFGVEFPDSLLNKSTFASISAIESALRLMLGER